jgi:hypothetical protein
MPRRLIYIWAPLVAGEVAIREAQSRDRATEAIVIGALKINARLHNGAGKGRADPLAVSTLIALAPSWWPGPRLGQDRVYPVERHQ